MAQTLEELAVKTDPRQTSFVNDLRVQMYRELIAGARSPAQIYDLNSKLAFELMLAGHSEAAIRQYGSLKPLTQRLGYQPPSRLLRETEFLHALAYLRLGEQENCLSNHTTASCILPIAADGVHKFPRGSRTAITMFEDQLSRQRVHDMNTRWLLNIAYMTLGEHPEKVPPQWLIPPSAFKSDYDIKRFEDVAGAMGLDVNDCAGGTLIEDLDNDGRLDILTSEWVIRGPMHFFHNDSKGGFVDKTAEAQLSGIVGGLSMIQGDYNNDGLVDVLVLRGAWAESGGNFPDSLLRNDGHGRFTDVTFEAGLVTYAPNQTAIWFDYNSDGWLDIYFGYESTSDNTHPCKLYRNNKDGTFTECAAESGVQVTGFVKAVVTADYNNDGRPDMYLSRLGQPNILFRNDGPRKDNTNIWSFTDVTAQARVAEPVYSFPAWFFDYDNDGWEDIWVSGYRTAGPADIARDYLGEPNEGSRAKLYRNKGDGTFEDVSDKTGMSKVLLTMGSNFGDLDNDGWLDMYLGTGDPGYATLLPNRAFRNAEGKKFQDVTTSGGFGHLQKGHGVSFADMDHDGDQDVYHSVGGAFEGDFYRNVLFENPGHGNNFICLKLEGAQSNRSALGARIKVMVEENGTTREIHRTVRSGGSFGASPLRQEIGIGKATAVKAVEIFWPTTGKRQQVTGVAVNRFHAIREGETAARLLDLKHLPFAKRDGHEHHHH
ncbi:MAG TPA: CRTAC1 family protein [Methylomirabilota bacterium]|nr:CRTAC1 family protein [Methylomirabilota bacterium]